MSCKDEFYDNDWQGYSAPQPRHGHRWLNIFRKERGEYPRIDVAYLPMLCMHCDDAPCIKAGKGSVYKRDDGIVMIDPEKAKSNIKLVDSCPYGAIYWNEELKLAQKCTMCAHLLDDGWEMPRCVLSCPTGAMKFYTMEPEEMEDMVQRENLSVYHEQYGTKPRVYYKNLHQFEKLFIAGGVIAKGECLEGATVTLTNDLGKTEAQTTNFFGDFKFDGIEQNTRYVLSIATETGQEVRRVIDTEGHSLSLGNMVI